MNLRERGLAVFGIEAMRKTSKLEGKREAKWEEDFLKVNDVLGAGLMQFMFPNTARVAEIKNGEWTMGQIFEKAPLEFVGDLVVIAASMRFAMLGQGWAALATKISYNTLVQIAPDVARLAKNKFGKKS